MRYDNLKPAQVKYMFICSIIADAILTSFNTNTIFSAHEKIWAAIINTIVLLILVVLLFYGTKTEYSGRFWLITAAFAYIWSAAGAFLDIERFYRFATDIHLSGLTIILLVLFVALYVLKCNNGAMSRAAQLFLMLFAVFGVLLIITCADKMSVLNLQHAYKSNYGIFSAVILTFKFPAALLLFASIPIESKTVIPIKSMVGGILSFFGIQVACAFLIELVFAGNASLYSQGVYAVAQVSSFSVFEHLEPMFFLIWLLAILIKGLILFYAAFVVIKKCFIFASSVSIKIWLVFITFIAIVVVSFLEQNVYTAISVMVAAFSACMLCIQSRSNN